jgi:hypothetical protein
VNRCRLAYGLFIVPVALVTSRLIFVGDGVKMKQSHGPGAKGRGETYGTGFLLETTYTGESRAR